MPHQYVDESLGENEHIVVRGRWPIAHWIGTWLALLLLGIFLYGIYIFITHSVRMLTTEFAVTDRRVILKWGWLNRRTAELAVGSVESVQLSQSIWGRMFGYGSLIVTGTGDSHIRFPPMAEAVKFRRAIESVRGNAKGEVDASKKPAPQPAP